ncbi:tetratricopeptide repeat protein [Pseudoduganella sp. UC29_71]|uniref:tetratricopeptide repeat protein n=1 Tax=Pseudoduganella sp. UC29_71 TaxID=3350174 RepID=UPI003670BF32
MQALKKAERTKQSALPDEEADKPSEAFDDLLALTPQDVPPTSTPARAAEFSLEPIDTPLTPAPVPRSMPELEAGQIPALTPAEEAPHDPTPPQARVGGARPRNELSLQDLPDTVPRDEAISALDPAPPIPALSPAAALAAAGKPDARTGERRQSSGQRISDQFNTQSAGASANGTATTGGGTGAGAGAGQPGTGAAAKARSAAAARATAAEDKVGWDPARIRLAVLGGILLLIVSVFGYIYWRATTAPGPGANLPMVPMPPPDAAGAKPGTIVVPPGGVAGPAGGASGMDASGAQSGAVSAGAGTGAGDHGGVPAAPPQPAQGQAPAAGPAAGASYSRNASSGGSMLGSSRNAPPASNTVMATPEEIERAMQMQAGQQGGTPPPFAAAAPAAGQGAGTGGVGGAGGAQGTGTFGVGGAGGTGGTQGAGWTSAAGAPAQSAAGGSGAAGNAASGAAGGAGTRSDAAWSSNDIKVSRHSNAPRLNPALQYGYHALQTGDLPTAADQYATALRQDPNNRDALLGNAAVALRRNDPALASASYMRLLELDPSDPDALAGLLSLRPGDTGQSEMRLKDMLRKSPGAGPLLFALGNLYSRQGRWTDAQQAYFRAYTANPDNPDYAFNLAVGLDRLNQPKLALNYYQRALALSQAGPAGFDSEAVRARMRQLAEPN